MQRNNLPPNWSWVKLGDIAEFKNGINFNKSQKGDSGILTIDVYNMYTSGVYVNQDDLYRVDKEIKDDYLLKYGDLLFVRSSVKREGVGFTTAFKEHSKNVTFCGFIIRARIDLNESTPEFLTYLLRSSRRRSEIVASAKQVTITNISQDRLRDILIPLPPLPEQHRIVEKIEELFSELDNGIDNLKKAKAQIKIYRQAVLKFAFEGKLVQGKGQNAKGKGENGELPEGWKWVKMHDVCLKIGDVDHKMPITAEDGKYPYLSTKDLTNDLKIDFQSAKRISENDFRQLSKKIKPERGDIIFPRYGTIGKNVLVETDMDFLVSYSCAIVKPDSSKVLSKYLYLYTLSPLIKSEIKKYTVQTTQANVGIGSIKNFIVPLPSMKTQAQIVEEIEKRFSVADKMEAAIDESLKKSEALRQSILKQAFEGKLVQNSVL